MIPVDGSQRSERVPAERIRGSKHSGEFVRPKFRSELELLRDEERGYFVRDSTTGREFRLGIWEHRIVQLLDGTRHPDDVRRDLAELHGVRCDLAVVHRFIGQLNRAGLLDHHATVEVPPPRVERRGALYMVRLIHADDLARRITARLRTLGRSPALVAAVGLVASAVVVAATHNAAMGAQVANAWTGRVIVPALCLCVLCGLVHEAAHALAASWFGARLVSAGAGIYYFRPCLFCEIRGLESLARWKRVVVSGAGVTSDVLQASICVIASQILPLGTVSDLLLLTAVFLGVRVALNLNPLLKLDGYYVLADLTGQRELREKALRTLTNGLRNLGTSLWRGRHPRLSRGELAYMVYGVLVIAYVGTMIGMVFVATERWLRTTVEGADLIIATLIVVALARFTASTLRSRGRTAPMARSTAARTD